MATRVPAGLTPHVDPARQGRTFGLTVGAAFLALAALAAWRGHLWAPKVFALLGALLLAAALLVPGRLGPVERAWMALAHAIGAVTTPLFMGLVYFGLLTPLALLRRALGTKPLRRRKSAPTFWVDRPPGSRRSDLERQF